ncbi:MAG: flagellar motor switch protein FliG [Deltaproteobacteria bacterium]|jgi:flagellar motor switch protein FliG|nr:flagellar motor switch protein FliG [Deltaproteobacteria bacterium]
MDARNLPGSLKTAILVRSLGPDTSQIIMNSLSDDEKKAVAAQMDQLGNVSPDLVEKIAEEFFENLKRQNQLPGGAVSGASPANGKQPDKTKSGGSNLAAITKLDPERLFKLVENEHPQTIAIILVHAKTETASDVMSRLPDEVKTDVALRIAKLTKVNSGMVDEINRVIESILSNKESSETHDTGGVDRLAEILNLADEMSSELIMGEIEEQDPELAAQIKQKMFVFEDIVLVDDKGFQKLLRKVETSELAVALKAASDEVKEKVFHNMSARAGDMLREEIADMGPVRMNDVSAAQQKITGLIQDMEFKGELIISGRRGEALVA